MIDVPLALAFTTGMVVTVNPCGFAMLPAYLSFFVGDDDRRDAPRAVARALVVGPVVTAGFVATFALLGLTVSQLTSGVYNVAPWMMLGVGAVLTLLGLAFVFGFEAKLRLPRLDRGGRTTTFRSMALFGVSYAVASVGCTLPLFIATMGSNFGRGIPSGIAFFAAYAAGFCLVITTLTVGIALAKGSVVQRVRGLLPFVHRVAGGLLVLTGLYVAHYGWVEIVQARSSGIPDSPIVSKVTVWSADVQNWILAKRDVLPLLLVLVLAFVGFGVWYVSGERPPSEDQREPAARTSSSKR